MASGPIPPWKIDRKQWKQCQTLFLGAPKSLQMVTAAMKLYFGHYIEVKETRATHINLNKSQKQLLSKV